MVNNCFVLLILTIEVILKYICEQGMQLFLLQNIKNPLKLNKLSSSLQFALDFFLQGRPTWSISLLCILCVNNVKVYLTCMLQRCISFFNKKNKQYSCWRI